MRFRFIGVYPRIRPEAVPPTNLVVVPPHVDMTSAIAAYHKYGEERWDRLDHAGAAIEATPEPRHSA